MKIMRSLVSVLTNNANRHKGWYVKNVYKNKYTIMNPNCMSQNSMIFYHILIIWSQKLSNTNKMPRNYQKLYRDVSK